MGKFNTRQGLSSLANSDIFGQFSVQGGGASIPFLVDGATNRILTLSDTNSGSVFLIKDADGNEIINALHNGITVGGNYTLPLTDGTANYVLKTDGSGVVSWGDPFTGLNVSSLADVDVSPFSTNPVHGAILRYNIGASNEWVADGPFSGFSATRQTGTVVKGTPVKRTGSSDFGSGLYEVGVGSTDNNSRCIGLAFEAPVDTKLIVLTDGIIGDLDTSAFSTDDVLYVSNTAGGLTNTAPTSGTFQQRVARVIASDATNGIIQVTVDPAFDENSYLTSVDGQSVGDLSNVNTSGAAAGNVLRYDGSDWVDSGFTIPTNAFAPTAGAAEVLKVDSLNVTSFGTLDIGDLADVDVATAAPTNDQVLAWDGSNFVPADAGGSGNVVLQINNSSGTNFTKGQAVYITGSTVQGIAEVDLADQDIVGGVSDTPSIGVCMADINTGTKGDILISGLLEDVDTSSHTAGDILYISSTPGDLTSTRSSSPGDTIQPVAHVIHSDGSAGKILVLAGRPLDVPNRITTNVTMESRLTFIEDTADSPTIYGQGSQTTGDGWSFIEGLRTTPLLGNGAEIFKINATGFDDTSGGGTSLTDYGNISFVAKDTAAGAVDGQIDFNVNGASTMVTPLSVSEDAVVIEADSITLDSASLLFRGGATFGGALKMYESAVLGGTNYMALQAPLSVTNDTTLTLPDGDGTNTQVLKTNGSGQLAWTSVLQQENPLVQGTLTIQKLSLTPACIVLYDEDDSNYIKVEAASTIASDWTLKLPAADGTNGQALVTDGSGQLSFATAGGGGSQLTYQYAGSHQLTTSTDTSYRWPTNTSFAGYGSWNKQTSTAPTAMNMDVQFLKAGHVITEAGTVDIKVSMSNAISTSTTGTTSASEYNSDAFNCYLYRYTGTGTGVLLGALADTFSSSSATPKFGDFEALGVSLSQNDVLVLISRCTTQASTTRYWHQNYTINVQY